MNFSITLSGLLVGSVIAFMKWAGIEIIEADIQKGIEAILLFGSAVAVYYGRYRHGDITWYGRKIKS